MKRVSFFLSFLGLVAAMNAQTFTVATFDSSPSGTNFTTTGSWSGPNQFTVGGGVLDITSVSSGNPTDSGYFAFADLPGSAIYDGSSFGTLSLLVTAQRGSLNAAGGFSINFFDNNGNGVLTATFSSDSFSTLSMTTVAVPILQHPQAGILTNISSYGIAGIGNGSSAFRFSFDQIAIDAIPEPSTYVLILMGLGLVGLAFRRRSNLG